jgi:hypothetical protein
LFLEVINKQIAGSQKTPTSVSCYPVHLYKHLDLLTLDEILDYESHMEAVEGGDPDQKEADHSDEDSEEEEVQEVVGAVTRKKNQELAKGKVPDWQTALDDDINIAVALDVVNKWSPFEQFVQIKRWSETGIKNSKALEKVIQDSAHLLK